MYVNAAINFTKTADQYLLEKSNWAKALREDASLQSQVIDAFAPLPFSLKFDGETGAAILQGDPIALLLFKKLTEELALPEHQTPPFGSARFAAILDEVVDNALKRDLSFRLPGLMYPVVPRVLAHVPYLRDLLDPASDLVFGIGPTGTGKSHNALVAGVSQLCESKFNHLVYCAPHVSCFSKGKTIDPNDAYTSHYAIVKDVLHDLIGTKEAEKMRQERRLEVLPFEHLVGRTFNKSFVVIDEAQHLTIPQMRMAVTRLGEESRMAITGNLSKKDEAHREECGLSHLLQLVEGQDIARVHRFGRNDIVRNPVVAKLEDLYTEEEQATKGSLH